MSRAYTKEEMREMFLSQCRDVAWFWSTAQGKTPREMCDGVAFSILNIIDGTSAGFPAAVTLSMDPHPSDRQYCIDNGEDWVEPDQVINDDVMLHDLYYS
jgi:hypothetical protein